MQVFWILFMTVVLNGKPDQAFDTYLTEADCMAQRSSVATKVEELAAQGIDIKEFKASCNRIELPRP